MGYGTKKIFFKRKLDDGTIIEAPLTIDRELAEVLDKARDRNRRDWDYISIVAGTPGGGKSTFAQNTLAPYCCRWFSNKYIAMTDEDFIRITTKCPDYSAVVLDESFASMNSKIMWSPEFLRIINHIQLIRQKRLFLFLCLPNFFDLSKSIAVFRSSHLFVPYENKEGRRGSFAAFGREEKTQLYILGSKFVNYNAVDPTFRGRFFKNSQVTDSEAYNKIKRAHFIAQNKKIGVSSRSETKRDEVIYNIFKNLPSFLQNKYPEIKNSRITRKEIASIINMKPRACSLVLQKFKDLKK